jgi:hypothetical protein
MLQYFFDRNTGDTPGYNPGLQPMPSGQGMNQPRTTMPMQDSPMTPGENGQSADRGGRDYRDDLRDLLDRAHSERGLTRYRLCKQMGIDSGTLSNVLAKRRHFSLEKLEQILGLLGYRLSFAQSEAGPKAIA